MEKTQHVRGAKDKVIGSEKQETVGREELYNFIGRPWLGVILSVLRNHWRALVGE